MIKHMTKAAKSSETVTLKIVAEHVGLAIGTVSLILNRKPQSLTLPQQTKDRVFAAAQKLHYQPNLIARALRTRQVSAVSGKADNGSRALVFDGAENFLLAVNALRRAGLSVPGDVAVVDANDISVTA